MEKEPLLRGAFGLRQMVMHQLLTPDGVSGNETTFVFHNDRQWQAAFTLLQERGHQLLTLNLERWSAVISTC